MHPFKVNLEMDGVRGKSYPVLKNDYVCNCIDPEAACEPIAIVRRSGTDETNGFYFLGCQKWDRELAKQAKTNKSISVPWCDYFQWVHKDMLLSNNPLHTVRQWGGSSANENNISTTSTSSSSSSSSSNQFPKFNTILSEHDLTNDADDEEEKDM